MAIQNFSPLQLNSTLTVGVDDTGHDVKFFGATSGKHLIWDQSEDQLLWKDSTKAVFGNGEDLQIYHQANAGNIITSNTSDIKISCTLDDGDIQFLCDDGNGGTATYLKMDGGLGYSFVNRNIRFNDDVEADFGSGSDAQIKHDGTDTHFTNGTGDLYITQNTDDKDIILSCDDGSNGVTPYLTLDGSAKTLEAAVPFNNSSSITSGGVMTSTDFVSSATTVNLSSSGSEFAVNLDDSVHIFGTGFTNTPRMVPVTTAEMDLGNPSLKWKDIYASGEIEGGSLDINGAADISGNTQLGGTLTVGVDGTGHDVKFFGDTSGKSMLWDESADKLIVTGDISWSGGATNAGNGNLVMGTGQLKFADGGYLMMGESNDLQLQHDGSNTLMTNITGNLRIRNFADDGDITFESDNGSGGNATYFYLDGGNGNIRFEKNLFLLDDVQLLIGSGTDLRMQHTGNQSYIQNYTGDFHIQNTADDKDIIFYCDDGSNGVEEYFRLDGSAGGGAPVTKFPDGARLQFGTGGDSTMTHDGSNFTISTVTGDFRIKCDTDDGDVKLQSDDGNGGVANYLVLDGGDKTLIASVPLVLEADSAVGWHGSVTRVKILPRDFQADSGGRPAMTFLGTNVAHLASNSSGKLFASVPIPTGFKATHVKIHGSDTGQTFTVKEANIANKTTVTKGTATAIETEKAITNVDSSTTNYILIEVTSDGTGDEIHGGYMTIAKI